MSRDFQKEVTCIGAKSSPECVRAHGGNDRVERFIRSRKENLLWLRWFDTIEDLHQALMEFQRTYNQQWLIERNGHRPPANIRLHQHPMQLAA